MGGNQLLRLEGKTYYLYVSLVPASFFTFTVQHALTRRIFCRTPYLSYPGKALRVV